ncbi:MAG: hypothetical protein ISQ14_14360 [Verrucomicrobiae bacterium]|nr:hypothetical protein [Verrucomicrobiae bacterium]
MNLADQKYLSEPWRKARICARFVLRPGMLGTPRYARLARRLVSDPAVTSRLVSQAVAHLRARLVAHGTQG